MSQLIKLKVAKNISAGSSETSEITPVSGKIVLINYFCGSAAFSPNSVVRLVWKYDHATEAEEVLWSIKGEQEAPHIDQIDSTETDGVRKLAVVVENGESSAVHMSGLCEVEII